MLPPADEESWTGPETALDSISQDLLESISTHAIFKLDEAGRIDS